MKRTDIDRREWQQQIHAHLTEILANRVTRQELANELHVTKQAISSYMTRRTTPKPHIVKRLLARWPAKLKFRDVEFDPGAYGTTTEMPLNPASRQQMLFDILRTVKKENMRVEVERSSASEIGLRVVLAIKE